ncbi:unnamed protein product [Coregonus sp. 'balchen']|nr:unnamed protein product [Coregonus sp. 'balchen']
MGTTVALLVMLFCLSGAWAQSKVEGLTHKQTTSGQTTTTADIWTELKELIDMVVQESGAEEHGGQTGERERESAGISNITISVNERRTVLISPCFSFNTVIFTSPVRGVYYFKYTVNDWSSSH